MLTKADTVKAGEEGKWFGVLRNQTFPIAHGYYITRQPSTEERKRGMQWEEARAQEVAFLTNRDCCWNKEDKRRLGTENLVHALSKQLSVMIAKR